MRLVGDLAMETPEDAQDAFEVWDWQERQAKWIVNSVRNYEFYGYEWRMPLWYNEIMDYWPHTAPSSGLACPLYINYMEDVRERFNLPPKHHPLGKLRNPPRESPERHRSDEATARVMLRRLEYRNDWLALYGIMFARGLQKYFIRLNRHGQVLPQFVSRCRAVG